MSPKSTFPPTEPVGVLSDPISQKRFGLESLGVTPMCSEGPQTAVGGGWGVPRGGTWGPPGEAVSGEAGCRAAAIGSCMWGDSRGPRAAEGAGAGPALSHSLRGLGQLTAAV